MSGREPEALTLEGLLAELPDDFSFFGDRYASEIAPALTAREGERLAAIGTRNRFRLGAVAGLALAGVSLAFAPPLVVMLALAGAAGLLAWGEATLEPIRRQTKTLLVEPVSRQFGLSFARLDGLQADPAPVAPLLERGEHACELDLTRAQDHRPAAAGEWADHRVGGMDGPHVVAEHGHGGDWIVTAEAYAAQALSIPLYPSLSEAQQDRVVAALTAALQA